MLTGAVQTFLPYPDFHASAEVLDDPATLDDVWAVATD